MFFKVRQPKMENVLEGYFNPDIQKPSLFYKNLIKTMMGEDADIDQLNTMIEFENKLLDLTKEEKAGSLMTFKQLQAFGYWVCLGYIFYKSGILQFIN